MKSAAAKLREDLDQQGVAYQYLDGEMGRLQRWRVRRHLRRCSPCGKGFTFETSLKQRIRRDCVDDVPEELVARITALLRQNGVTDPSAGPTAGGSDV